MTRKEKISIGVFAVVVMIDVCLLFCLYSKNFNYTKRGKVNASTIKTT